MEGIGAARLGKPAARLAGNGKVIQITPQMRVLVAVEVNVLRAPAVRHPRTRPLETVAFASDSVWLANLHRDAEAARRPKSA